MLSYNLTADVIAAYVANNVVSANELPGLIIAVHRALVSSPVEVAGSELSKPAALVPAVPIKKSVTRDYIVCLEDGKRFRSMRGHLKLMGMSPDEYRQRWGLPQDYPMVAPSYSETRRTIARDTGLGNRRG